MSKDRMYCGIDPGYKTGGVAFVCGDWAEVHDLPLFDEGGVNSHELDYIFNSVPIDFIVIEKQSSRPMQGVASAFKLGMGYGQVLATVSMIGIKHQIITPASWKKAMRVPADKDGARRMAIQQFPALADRLNRKKDEHRAEALLMATYAKAVEFRNDSF